MQGCEITLVLQANLPQMFKDGGWTIPDFGKTRMLYPKDDDDIRNLVFENEDAVHIFSGIRFPMVRTAFLHAVGKKGRIGLLSESADWRGLEGFARFLLYRLEFLRFRARIDFILAIGRQGVQWYRNVGFSDDKIYPFAYVVEKYAPGASPSATTDTIRLIYVGQLIRRKGVDVLLSALTRHRRMDWHLDIVGDGPERNALLGQVTKAALIDKVSFHGALRNDIARQMIARSDCLVLPSRWDGWGAVINEALMQGVPVICSDACGASDLLGSPERGEMFQVGSVKELANVLERWILNGKRTRESSVRIKAWTESIEGETIARYLLDVIGASTDSSARPVAPWRN